MKIFEKKKKEDGRQIIYLFGKKILCYKKKQTNTVIDYFYKFIMIKNPSNYIRSLGVKVGENVSFIIHPHFFSYPDFGSEPYLIEIDDNVKISFSVCFVTHDGGVYAMKQAYNEPERFIRKVGKIHIKSGAFIGCHSIIMPGVTIGKNSVIGAGSVVTKDVGDNEVWAGVPAKFIKTIEKYRNNIEEQFLSEESVKLNEIIDKHNLS